MNGLVICVNMKYHIEYIFYGWTLSNCSYIPIMLMEIKYYLSEDNDTTVFYWGDSYKL